MQTNVKLCDAFIPLPPPITVLDKYFSGLCRRRNGIYRTATWGNLALEKCMCAMPQTCVPAVMRTKRSSMLAVADAGEFRQHDMRAVVRIKPARIQRLNPATAYILGKRFGIRNVQFSSTQRLTQWIFSRLPTVARRGLCRSFYWP